MNLEQQTRAREITLIALGLEGAEQKAYLHRRAAAEPEVLAEVHRRLELAGMIPDDFLDRPAADLEGPDDPIAAPAGELPSLDGGRYRLEEILGNGGMAVVYRAYDRQLDRRVAIKRQQLVLAGGPRAIARFEREARATARVSHPAVVEIFDVLRERDDLWIVMELVPGRPLASQLAEGRLELLEALLLAVDIAGGLAAAHELGVVHRDLKAANVMVTPRGGAKILDFGLATLASSGPDGPTASGERHGTPAAMSPEQVSGALVDSRSDLFSFGILLYQMVTGVSPFSGPSVLATLDRVCRLRPPPARRLEPRVPEELSTLIESLLEKDPDCRPRDTAAVARTLSRLAESTADPAIRRHLGEQPAGEADSAFPSAGVERRQVTVLSCQLVVAGDFGALLDPEELLAIEEPFRELAVSIVKRWHGCLDDWLDGGFRAYFGLLRAREDDPCRALSAALELTAAVERWSVANDGPAAGTRLRAGVHTGPIVVNRRPTGPRLVLGRTGCCATELRTAEARLPVAPGGVLVSAAARELVRWHFRCESLGACSLALCQLPLEVYLVRQGAGGDGDTALDFTPFVGREAELGLLHRRWRQAAAGSGQVALLTGEAGSGKSRLVQVFREQVAGESTTWLEVSCRPGALLRQLAGVLGSTLGAGGDEAAGAWVGRLVEQSENAATVLTVEDIHLADPSDLDLLGLLIDRAPRVRLLILLTCRPPFDPPWKPPPHLTVCSLSPLTGVQSRRMFRYLVAGQATSAVVEAELIAAADGVPRFVEELSRMVVRTGRAWSPTVLPDCDGTGPRPPIAVPASLKSWLTARLDRLGDAREVVRAASVLGREFTLEQLRGLLPSGGDAVPSALNRLVEAEILQRRGGTYRFRYALDRSAAYESLLREHRRLYRRRWRRALAPRRD